MKAATFDPFDVNGERVFLNAALRIAARELEQLETRLGLTYVPLTADDRATYTRTLEQENAEARERRARVAASFAKAGEQYVFPDPRDPARWMVANRCYGHVIAGAPIEAYYRAFTQGVWRVPGR